jgi:hypothetical protein
MTYALRACSRALLAGSNPAPASGSQVAAGGDRWLLMAVRGHLGDTPGARLRSWLAASDREISCGKSSKSVSTPISG